MINKPFLYLLAKVAAIISLIALNYTANVDITLLVISTLSFICIFLLELLLERTLRKNKVVIFTVCASAAACFALGITEYFPLYLILLVQLIDLTIDSKMFYYILGVAGLLSYLIFLPDLISSIMSIILLSMLLLCRIALDKLHAYKEINESQKETIAELKEKLQDVKRLMKTLKYTASIEERNRFTARIHDQIGHGISGSIIMLEASLMIIGNNPEKAAESIQKAVANLRVGVDEIRMALRDERVGTCLIGINEVKAMLEEFKLNYNKSAVLNTLGDLNMISIEKWTCIHDNLKECLTNVLKHSNATEFILNIEVFKKIIKVEYKDNGRSGENFEKGLGLEAMEERTVNAKGHCFFNKGANGFVVTNIFTH
jgi:signal transduction histidine kinase